MPSNCQLSTTHDGLKALEVAQQEKPDAIVLDAMAIYLKTQFDL